MTNAVEMTPPPKIFTPKIRRGKAQYAVEEISEGIGIEMMLIPEGAFLMGSPLDELERFKDEGPQHLVTVKSFFMGKYPITQAQWRIVAGFPQEQRELKQEPSGFKGDNRPAEKINWFDAVEFCARLSKKTGRHYRLPTEAEWEYACRAGTNSPFHFGETITTDIANYRGTDEEGYGWKGNYGEGPKGEYRKETTSVDKFVYANAFGLCDMHGNVWEWCEDYWHENYEKAPSDGRAWLTDRDGNYRVLRGGSWFYNPLYCRCARRLRYNPDYSLNNLGFRVVCEAPRTLA